MGRYGVAMVQGPAIQVLGSPGESSKTVHDH
jgi:hypothetical protein